MRFRFSRRRTSFDRLRGIWLVVVGLVFIGTTLVAEDHDANKAKSPTAGNSTTDAATAAELRLRSDVTFLADDAQEGRAPGTKGIEAAAQYIANIFKGAGLKPAPGAPDYFQPFTISGSPQLGKHQDLAFAGPEGKELKGTLSTDFRPLAIGSGATFDKVPVVFAGYGITAKDGSTQARLRRLRGHRRQGEGCLDHPARAPAGQPVQSVRGHEDNGIRHVPTQGDQRFSAWSSRGPARQRPGRSQECKGSVVAIHGGGHRVNLDHPIRDA